MYKKYLCTLWNLNSDYNNIVFILLKPIASKHKLMWQMHVLLNFPTANEKDIVTLK